MQHRRVLKTKTFDRWAKKLVPDALLCLAASEIERGLFEADLGQGVCKKRIALPGRGKSGSTRALVAKQHRAALFFIAGRGKSDVGTDFSRREEEAAKLYAGMLHKVSEERFELMLVDGALKEIRNGDEVERKK